MDPSRLAPGTESVIEQQERARRVKDAREMYEQVVKNAERSNTAVPPFEFLELIGKGAYGRVYKCRDKKTGSLVAIKITELDQSDWETTLLPAHLKAPSDSGIREVRKEVSVLQQLKDKGIPNVNVLHDAFDMHSQLWMVSDYCTGGSVRTLMRPFAVNDKPRGLPEKYIIPIAREVAIAMAACHDSGIIHRDIKCANIYITEDGNIQLGDFGIVGILENETDKRKTVVGTPHWMPQELAAKIAQGIDEDEIGYRYEVDIWAYGCTLYEMATGHPPNDNVIPESLHVALSKDVPRLTDESYSPELRDLIARCLEAESSLRATAKTILQHPAIAKTSEKYPTSRLVQLIERFMVWERRGGSRQSLWFKPPNQDDDSSDNEDDDHRKSTDSSFDGWNFSTSEDYVRRFSQLPSFDTYLQGPHGAGLPPDLPQSNTNMTIADRIKLEHKEKSASRGEKSLARLYDPNDPTGYESASATPSEPPEEEPSPISDLPLRNFTSDAPTRESMIEIDLDDASMHGTATSTFALHMENQNTIKPIGRKFPDEDDDNDQWNFNQDDSGADKRNTMAWTFPSAPQPTQQLKRGTLDWTFSNAGTAEPEEPDTSMNLSDQGFDGELGPAFRPSIRHTNTEPVGHFRDFSHDMGSVNASPGRDSMASMIDLDLGIANSYEHLHDPAEIIRPSTASSAAGSTMTDMTSGNPFDLEEDPVLNEIDRQRFSYHKQWQSEGGSAQRNSLRTMPMHARGSSLSSNDSDLEHMNAMNQRMQPGTSVMQHPPFSFDQSSGGFSPDEMNQWPNFSSFDSFDTSPQYYPTTRDIPRLGEPSFPLEHGLRAAANGISSRSREPSAEPSGPAIDFPAIDAPHPDALLENAEPQLLGQEFSRMCDDLAMALSSLGQGLGQFAGIDEDYEGPDLASDIESGFESNREGTEDEGAGEQLTYRRARTRKPEVRSSPRMLQSETSQ